MRALLFLLLLALAGATQAAGLRFALVKTAETETLDAFTVEDGAWTEKVIANHVAVLIEHHAATLLLDTSLGRQVDRQFDSEMPWYDKPLLQYGAVTPVRDQLDRDGVRVDRILLTHSHWDHASGLADFPEVPVWAPYEEIEFSRIAVPPAVLPSQFAHAIRWVPYQFDDQPFMGFERSHDLFGDGSLVLVPLAGHTPGGVGLFLTLDDGRRFFFTGDASWRLEGFTGPREKFWISRNMVDNDREGTRLQLEKVHALLQEHPGLTVVPAHDESVQRKLGYYPHWVE
ncbi:MBL fold metallo-hydrolase [Pseudomonas sp. Gutcm_11s]|uniref:MBL fold metallo-hydrolase n=1 Tax=Pseudomonas sp. Gutcm_11s TaxID=3026088 RepID=UPI00235FD8F9|nr:MBL fold metallo-hydrolase [Pseudomonas sp. Gutcm_11s]MDD0843904.1 MBL fold metallo-hydrolase [Pseudomonas sp. Gutcm_11s]